MNPTSLIAATVIADRQREAETVRRARAAHTRALVPRTPTPLRAAAAWIASVAHH
jgi:hypothetical protein